MDLKTLFRAHLDTRMAALADALGATGFDTLVISSGQPFTYFADDQEAPFNTIPHFRHYCPIEGPHHVLVLKAGAKPTLIRYAPEDFWYEQMPLGHPFWAESFNLVEAATLDAAWASVSNSGRGAYIGNETERAEAAGLSLNPENLTVRLDWFRAVKTPYEVACIEEAAAMAARGHEAGRRAFYAGANELEIHHAYVQAVGCVDYQLAFNSIVGLNEKSATLHYEKKRIDVRQSQTCLLDCGARFNGYASDITRSYAAGFCDDRWKALLAGMEKLELELCAEVKVDRPFGELHVLAHAKIAALLHEVGVLTVGAQEATEKRLTRPFMPHGLGHQLGIQVHDVGGKLAGPDGTLALPPDGHTLRNTRTISAGQVLTIEPGLYFIPMLLRPFREGEHSGCFNWKLIDDLTPLGGIRIEDDVLATPAGPRNLTRPYLPW